MPPSNEGPAPLRVGLISDIHGSRAALECVWQALERDGLTQGLVLNAGDNVGYGDDPEGCVAFLRARPNILTVQGNYDRNVACYPDREPEYRRKWAKSRPEKFIALRRDSDLISPEVRAWLLDLPRERLVALAGVPVLLTHYAPGVKRGLGRWTSDAELAKLAQATDARIVVCGHTHSPFVRLAGGTLFVNPGTVGRGLYGGPAYAILTLGGGQPPSTVLKQVKS